VSPDRVGAFQINEGGTVADLALVGLTLAAFALLALVVRGVERL
jgi:hypothetical protein